MDLVGLLQLPRRERACGERSEERERKSQKPLMKHRRTSSPGYSAVGAAAQNGRHFSSGERAVSRLTTTRQSSDAAPAG